MEQEICHILCGQIFQSGINFSGCSIRVWSWIQKMGFRSTAAYVDALFGYFLGSFASILRRKRQWEAIQSKLKLTKLGWIKVIRIAIWPKRKMNRFIIIIRLSMHEQHYSVRYLGYFSKLKINMDYIEFPLEGKGVCICSGYLQSLWSKFFLPPASSI
jgi:hypothetical protein